MHIVNDINDIDISAPSIKKSLRVKADYAKEKRCNTLICVIENPKFIANISTIVRNINTLGVSKLYVVDSSNVLPSDWNKMRSDKQMNTLSCSAIKWTYIKKFNTTPECITYLQKKN